MFPYNITQILTRRGTKSSRRLKHAFLGATALGLVIAFSGTADAHECAEGTEAGTGNTLPSALECGTDAEAVAEDAIAIGENAQAGNNASNVGAIAIGGDQDGDGFGAHAGTDAIAIGRDAQALSLEATAIGTASEASAFEIGARAGLRFGW
ncbi:MAG: hypothetical protein AAGJ84_07410 [Pseudomonadota bacterium]